MIASSFLRTSPSTRLLLLASRRPLSTSTLPLLSPPRPARRRRTAQEFLAVPRRAPSSHPPPPGPTGSPVLEQAKQVSVDVPEDSRGVLKSTHGSRVLLEQSALVITRKIEMMNIFLGFEQGNRYQICNPEGEPVGFIAEEAQGILGTISRQLLRTHRPFRAVIMDVEGNPILWVRRPFQFINSRIFVEAREGTNAPLVGEAQQDWHLWRRKYNLFLSRPSTDPTTGALVPAFDQFASIDERFWSWEFWLRDAEGRARGSVSRNFGGFGREIFTDTGTYILRFDAVNAEISDAQAHGPVVDPKTGVEVIVPPPSEGEGLTLDERAVALATAISIDFDYFSRHSSHSSGMGLPFFPFFGGGGGSDLDNASSSPSPLPSDDDPSLPPTINDDHPDGSELPPGIRDDPSQPPGFGEGEDRPWWENDAGGEGEAEGDVWRGDGEKELGEGEEVWGESESEEGGWGGGGGGGGGGDGGSIW